MCGFEDLAHPEFELVSQTEQDEVPDTHVLYSKRDLCLSCSVDSALQGTPVVATLDGRVVGMARYILAGEDGVIVAADYPDNPMGVKVLRGNVKMYVRREHV